MYAKTDVPRRRFLCCGGSQLSAIALSAFGAGGNRRGVAAEVTPGGQTKIDSGMGRDAAAQFVPRAKQVIEIFCSGALSHVDTFDYKPALERWHGKPLPGNEQLVSFQGPNGNLTKSLWPFRPRGQSGKMTSDLLPRIGALADEMCFVHSLTNKSNTHGPAENVMNTGFAFDGFPSMGAWIHFALGSENENLPAFVAIEDPRGMPQSGPNNWANGFLPAAYQGTAFNANKPIRHLAVPPGMTAEADQAAWHALQLVEQSGQQLYPGDSTLSARAASYALAARMQLSIPEATGVEGETAETLRLYGAEVSEPIKASFARNCILARRLIERGVRFVQVFNGAYASGGQLNWDAHSQLEKQYETHGEILDQPVAGLLLDLKRRGLLDSTLVIFTTEFGRMPMFQAGTFGRDHNPNGFTCWLAGGGVKRGYSFGATDEFGFAAVENKLTVHDLHATVLYLLGLDHKRLTYYHNGIQRRLTDVHGRIVKEIVA